MRRLSWPSRDSNCAEACGRKDGDEDDSLRASASISFDGADFDSDDVPLDRDERRLKRLRAVNCRTPSTHIECATRAEVSRAHSRRHSGYNWIPTDHLHGAVVAGWLPWVGGVAAWAGDIHRSSGGANRHMHGLVTSWHGDSCDCGHLPLECVCVCGQCPRHKL